MPLILAVEPDRRQAHELTAIVRGRLRATLVLADAAEPALAQLGDRVPDLILTSALLSTKDEAALADWLRKLDAAAAHVQTLTIPVLDTPTPRSAGGRGGLFSMLSDRASSPAIPDGCDPAVFAEQCAAYLERAATERAPIESEVQAAPIAALDDVGAPHDENAAADEESAAPPQRVLEPVLDNVEIDLSAMLDEKVFQQLSAAIETVSRDSGRRETTATTTGEVWKPSSLGSAAVWPAMDFTSGAQRAHSTDSASTRSPAKRFPRRRPIQDEWGFFDPAQCGFSALLAKLDEITHMAPSLPPPDPSAGPPALSR